MTRRSAVSLPFALAGGLTAAPSTKTRATGLSLNEDPNHFYASRVPRRVTRDDLIAWVDQYAGTQVRELILCVNAQRTAFASRTWTPFWHGYEPAGSDDQKLFRSQPPEARKSTRAWVHAAWQMNADGLDQFRIWIARARQKGLSPWLSIRMNDLHNVDDEEHSLHSDFWRAHPEFRRVPYRGEMRDRALDFGHAEVRDYTFRLIEEVTRRYDFDGLELDWMRHGFHFAPGGEEEGRVHLNEFMRRVRRLLGPKKKIGVRVPPHPDTALRLGMDAVEWARGGSADLVVPTNFWRTADTNLPVRLWRRILPEWCLLGGGVELGLNPHHGSVTADGKGWGANSLQTVRGVASAILEQGADRVYLFNYMDSQTAIEDLAEYPPLLRQCGSLMTLRGKPRRHVLTYCDTWAPGEAQGYQLPATIEPGKWRAFRLATGPAEPSLTVRLRLGMKVELPTTQALADLPGCHEALPNLCGLSGNIQVRVNNAEAKLIGLESPERPWPNVPVYAFDVPAVALRSGDTVIDVFARIALVVSWVEVARS